ncbi:MAG: Nif3-like dinuclear metal center hexameric protein [Deltaproteobacteria bacterium]|nr:Nif3-like dinuclear metal center hexameric protein [Deltaproteobacteria bacterium]
MDRSALLQYLETTLRASEGQDYCPNGLQVEGRSEITKIVTGVSACQELFDRAHQAGADAVLVHHGLFWTGMPYPLTGLTYRRVSTLIKNDINLLAYHLPLDRHPELGNNALAAQGLGLTDLVPFGDYKGYPIGFAGHFQVGISPQELNRRAATFFDQQPQAFLHGPDPVSSLAIISGGAQKEFYQAIDQGYDAFITGEVSEWVMNLARESQTHFLACGHYATERCGIRTLGEHLAEKFSLEVEFIDVPNPI